MFKDKTRISIILIILTGIVAGSSIIVSSQGKNNRVEISSSSGLKQPPGNLTTSRPAERRHDAQVPQNIPVDVTYRQIFKHIAELDKKAEQEIQKGRSGKELRDLYKKMARLTGEQARHLDRIAKKTNRELKKLDDRARQIVEKIRARTPNRRIEQGQKVPLPTQELFDLAKQRREITLKAIRDLRESFGEVGFVVFTKFIHDHVKPVIKKKGNGTDVKRGGQQ